MCTRENIYIYILQCNEEVQRAQFKDNLNVKLLVTYMGL